MENSKIIKELANSAIDLNTSLKRAKVIFQKIGSTELNQWIKNEIEGYKNLEDIMIDAKLIEDYVPYDKLVRNISHE